MCGSVDLSSKDPERLNLIQTLSVPLLYSLKLVNTRILYFIFKLGTPSFSYTNLVVKIFGLDKAQVSTKFPSLSLLHLIV